jgi:uncharacterized protein (TIGR00375 family)
MKELIVDLHIHSKFSRACSKDLTLPNIAKVAAEKGIHLMGTGDFTHPAWSQMMKEELKQNEHGFYEVKDLKTLHSMQFVPTVEIACIYKKNDQVRRLHLIVVAPDLKAVFEINERLAKIGNIAHDGRPILGLDAKELLKIILDVDSRCMLIPAHAWTPWFAIFGSKSGFNSIEECFDELAHEVTAIETGLSSDPPMNRQISNLDNIVLVSNSDAHSLDNLGREANVFDASDPLTYDRLRRILRNEESGLLYTIEFYPEEGKYHADGHASCKFRCTPKETKKHGGKCPMCKRPITVGVLSRVNELADRPLSQKQGKVGHKYIVPLREIISEVVGKGKKTKTVDAVYTKLVPKLGTEFEVLIDLSFDEITKHSSPQLAEAIKKMRIGDIVVEPGYDGVFGTVQIFTGAERDKIQQIGLF